MGEEIAKRRGTDRWNFVSQSLMPLIFGIVWLRPGGRGPSFQSRRQLHRCKTLGSKLPPYFIIFFIFYFSFLELCVLKLAPMTTSANQLQRSTSTTNSSENHIRYWISMMTILVTSSGDHLYVANFDWLTLVKTTSNPQFWRQSPWQLAPRTPTRANSDSCLGQVHSVKWSSFIIIWHLIKIFWVQQIKQNIHVLKHFWDKLV